MIRLSPKKNDRYGYVLYVDELTNVLLQIDVVNPVDGKMVESYMATHFVYTDEPNRIIMNISEAYLKNSESSEKASEDAAEDSEDKEKSGDESASAGDGSDEKPVRESGVRNTLDWKLSYVPVGYELVKCEKNYVAELDIDVEHLLYTDGLSDVSVYRIKALEGNEFPVVKQGTTNMFRYRIEPYEIVVVGDIMMETEKNMAESYRENDKK